MALELLIQRAMRLPLSALLCIASFTAQTSLPQEARANGPSTILPGVAPADVAPSAASSSTTSKGSLYFTEGLAIGRVRGELASRLEWTMALQVGLGYQPAGSSWAYEIYGGGGAAFTNSGIEHATLLRWGLQAKRFHLINSHLRVYARGGVSENYLRPWQGASLVGFGVDYGAGAEASMRVRALGLLFWPLFFAGIGPKVDLGLYVDVGGAIGNLHTGHNSGAENYNYRTATAGYGIRIGTRF